MKKSFVIQSEKEYLKILERFEGIFQAKKGTKESKEANMLSLLIKKYEKNKYG